MYQCGLKIFGKQNHAVASYHELRGKLETNRRSSNDAAVFAHSKPSISNSLSFSNVRAYLVGTMSQFWRFTQFHNGACMLEEMVVCNQIVPLYLDIEVKRMEIDRDFKDVQWIDGEANITEVHVRRFWSIVKAHVHGVLGYNMSDEAAKLVTRCFVIHSCKGLTEEECQAGICVMTEFCTNFFREHMGVSENKFLKINAVSGCRESKFSVHIVMKGLVCDSAVRSMPLLVYELSKAFLKKNLQIVLDCQEELGGGRSM